MAFRDQNKLQTVANDMGGDFGADFGGDIGGSDYGGTGDIPSIGEIMDRAAASGSADALPGFTTPTANDTLDDNKSNPNDFPVDAVSEKSTNLNDFPVNTDTVNTDDNVPEVTITGDRPKKSDVPEMVITGNRPTTPAENTRSIDVGGGAGEEVLTPVAPPVTPVTPAKPVVSSNVSTPVTTPVAPTPPVVTPPPVVAPPTDGPGPGETEAEWRLRMGQTGYGNLTDFDKEVARLKGNMDTGVSTSKGLISANMKPPGG